MESGRCGCYSPQLLVMLSLQSCTLAIMPQRKGQQSQTVRPAGSFKNNIRGAERQHLQFTCNQMQSLFICFCCSLHTCRCNFRHIPTCKVTAGNLFPLFHHWALELRALCLQDCLCKENQCRCVSRGAMKYGFSFKFDCVCVFVSMCVCPLANG